MKRLLTAISLGSALGSAATYLAFSYYIVRADDEWVVVRKPQPSLDGNFVDIREWKIADWTRHANVARALIDHGRRDLVKPLSTGQMFEVLLHGLEQAGQSRDHKQRR